MRGIRAVTPLCAVVLLLGSGCRWPFSEVDRPSFANPVDPDSRIPIETVIERIETENDDPEPLVRAILATRARYNTDVTQLWFDHSSDPIVDTTGVVYLPRLERSYFFNGGGSTTLNLSGFRGHVGLEELYVYGFDPFVLGTLPPLSKLRKLDLSSTTGVDFNAMYEQSLEELVAMEAGIVSLDGIERLGPIKILDIRGTNTYPDSEFTSVLPLLADSLEVLRSRVPGTGITFLDALPNLTGIGFEIGGALTEAFMEELLAYDRITLFGAYGMGSIESLNPIVESGIAELELHRYAAGGALDLSALSSMSLRRVNVSKFTAPTGLGSLPDTLEEVEFIDTGFTDAGRQLDTIAASLPNVRRLDLSRNPGITSLAPIAAHATTMANLEEIRVEQEEWGGAPDPSYGLTDITPANGIASLTALTKLRVLSIRNSYAAYRFTLDNVDIGISALWRAFDGIKIDAGSEDA